MPSARQKKSGWLIPEPIDGYDLICYCVPIPNHPMYRAAFQGAMSSMGKWFNWERSYTPDDRRATDVAAMFRALYEDITVSGCNTFRLRQNPEDFCEVQQSYDGGETWETAWFLNLCEAPVLTYRYNETTGIYESSPDGGLTWEDATDVDPRFTSPTTGITGAGDLRCKAAENVTTYLQGTIDEMDNAIETGATVVVLMGIITAVIAVIITGGLAIPIAISLVSALLFLTSEQFDEYFDAVFWEELKCYIYCRTPEDGQYHFDEWANITSGLETEFTTPAGTIIKYLIQLMGSSGLTNAAALGEATGESCVDCECEQCVFVVNFEEDSDPYEILNGTLGTVSGGTSPNGVIGATFTGSGSCAHGKQTLTRVPTECIVDTVTMDFRFTHGSLNNNVGLRCRVFAGGILIANLDVVESWSKNAWHTKTFIVGLECDYIEVGSAFCNSQTGDGKYIWNDLIKINPT